MRRVLPVVASVLLVVGCGGGSSPTAPTPSFPVVSGTYTGSVTFTYPEIGQSVSCPASTSVTQTGANISIAPLILGGACVGLSIPVGNETIDQNGSFGNLTNYTYTEPSCGTYTASGSGGFFGRQLQFSITAVSATCLNINVTGTLTR